MAAQLPQPLLDRAAKARRLLAHPASGLAGSWEVEGFAESVELSQRLHELLLDEGGEQRQGLSLLQRREAKEMGGELEQAGCPFAICFTILRSTCGLVLRESQGDCAVAARLSGEMLAMLDGDPDYEAMLDVAFSQIRPGVALTGCQLILTVLAVRAKACMELCRQPPAPPAQLAAVDAALARLLARDPLRSRHHSALAILRSIQGRDAEAAQALRTQLQLATEEKGVWAASTGAAGPTDDRSLLRQLLQQCKEAAARAKLWLPSAAHERLRSQYKGIEAAVRELEARHPGQEWRRVRSMQELAAHSPMRFLQEADAQQHTTACAACGKLETQVCHLQRCSGCRAVS
ncbi:hypothetical protein ABPG75_013608 [Micractinium tetrahymenae]